MSVQIDEIRAAVRAVDAAGRPIVVHASLRSFGHVHGGANTVVEGLLAERCTVLVPTFSQAYAVVPLPHERPARNGYDYARLPPAMPGTDRVFTVDSTEIDRDSMGAVPAAVLERPERQRGSHPLNSFSAIGPLAEDLIAGQALLDVYAPLRRLAELDGIVILMGVGLDRLSLLHLAEQRAGRRMFRRWANGPDGRPIEVERGGCSAGFVRFDPILRPFVKETQVGESRWQIYPAREALQAATAAIRQHPEITRCADPSCYRCEDAILGGPLLSGPHAPGDA